MVQLHFNFLVPMYKFAEKLKLMIISDTLLECINIPSKTVLDRMSDKDLFELANLNRKFKQVMIKFILSEDFKPNIPLENKFYIRKMGLPERIKNSLLQNEFEYPFPFV